MKKFFGKKAVIEAFKQNELSEVYYVSYFDELKEFKSKNIKLNKVNKKFFDKYEVVHQNILGIAKESSLTIHTDFDSFIEKINNLNTDKKIILVLDEIQDPGNFGAICRTSKSFQVAGIIFKKNNQIQINETVIKTSLGTVNYLNFLKVNNLSEVLNKLKKENYWTVCTALDEKSIPLSKFKTDINKLVVIVGNENKGVSELIKKDSDFIVKIEMDSSVQSLNVSVSTAIILYYLTHCL
ncbi:23S rRNA (guanosine(2251)-2'-O)-methyltransferase RlmB [Malacoplasma penetrans]|uniref:rRNA methylase n=1 Tax=Malacoplasma penetrans (strain HF-2) TaxID=272633 RepID=Q8EX27_MALP2|nr:23S rRNA (guanosine(2251)-2'-O)-methyltransferase RlmB [Malacoplasma penetrans]RXY97394.1 23S rRNA (guanosine(2251)-2'-O)-methyltransferase RlmB [Malacoplasma penetrans]BAC43813.1 rRNA methylase [Malacoplasma penetrans HF-2]